MTRFNAYLLAAVFLGGIFSPGFAGTAHAQKSQARSFYIESQPDSPVLIRDLTATILPVNEFRSAPALEAFFFAENRSKKKIKVYSYQKLGEKAAEKAADLDERWGRNLLPGEFVRIKDNWDGMDGETLYYRISEVEFEDGTKWKAEPFNAAKAKKSARIKALPEKPNNSNSFRTLSREWTTPIIADRVERSIETGDETIEGVKLQTKLHLMKPERLGLIETCKPESDQMERAYNDEDYDIEKFTTYEIDGKTFAYVIHYELIDAKNQFEIGAGIQNVYVDETGSGTFKLRCDVMELKSLPEWVKASAEK